MPRKRTQKVRLCEWCGHLIGLDRGPAAKTCTPECQRDRNNALEKARYRKVKDSVEWKATRSSYIDAVKKRMQTDVDFAEHRLAQRKAIYRRFRAKLESDPARLERYRAECRAWHHSMTPEQRAARKYWYGGLAADLKALFLADLRKKRARQRLKQAQQRTLRQGQA